MALDSSRIYGNCKDSDTCRILICPSGFKESLNSTDVANNIEHGIRRVLPSATITKVPMIDGGEGFTEHLVKATQGRVIQCTVLGPVCEPIESKIGFLGGLERRVAVIEMAAAAGLSLVPRDRRNPIHTTTYGVGHFIRLALDEGAEEILLGCGDSGTCDGGIGMAQALGARFFDSYGQEIPLAAGEGHLHDLRSVDLSNIDDRLWGVPLRVACNWHNVLCGPGGVARVFGPQKGASESDVERLAVAMDNVAQAVSNCIQQDIACLPGSGASGGLGAGLLLIGAEMFSRFDIIAEFLNIDGLLSDCDLVITAEGGIDHQTPHGKGPSYVAAQAQAHGIPVVALTGTVGEGASINYSHGIDAYTSILKSPMPLETAIEDTPRLLTDAAENVIRMLMVGWNLHRVVELRREQSSRSSSCVSR